MTDLRPPVEVSDPTDPSVVVLRGEVDMATAPAIEVTVRSRLRAGYRDLTIDLSDVTFMDSQGLNALVRAHAALTADGGELRLRAPSGPVLSALSLSGLDQVLPVETSARRPLIPGSPARGGAPGGPRG